MERLIVLILAVFLIVGCVGKSFGDHTTLWNSWVGSTKDDRVRELGIPTRCHQFKNGGEMCEWPYRTGIDGADIVNLSFNSKGIVCQWGYRGFYGDRRSEATCQ